MTSGFINLLFFSISPIEAEVGPYIKMGAEVELSDACVAGLVGAMHMTDLYLKSGVNINAETDMTLWFGFGEPTVLFDEDFFKTKHVSFPEITMDTRCEDSSEINIVKSRAASALKDGNRLPISKACGLRKRVLDSIEILDS